MGQVTILNMGKNFLEDLLFEELISKSQKISLKPEEEKDVTFELKIPKSRVRWNCARRIYCYEDTEGKEEQSKGLL